MRRGQFVQRQYTRTTRYAVISHVSNASHLLTFVLVTCYLLAQEVHLHSGGSVMPA